MGSGVFRCAYEVCTGGYRVLRGSFGVFRGAIVPDPRAMISSEGFREAESNSNN